ncbi:MAG: tRNA-dihydrouridine synthase, partial [Candidatus Bathyarchaeia archaeon]
MSGFVDRLKESRLLLPPLADYTDYPYRRILAEFDPPFMCTEMISPEALVRENQRTMEMVKMVEGNHLNGVQLVGSDVESMRNGAIMVEAMGYDYIDINMGCTVKTVTRTGAGLALMSDEDRAVSVTSAVVDAVDIPVTCKMRMGLTLETKNAESLSRKLVNEGISAITIHGRTGEKKFGLAVDLDGIKKVVDSIDVPVIANGGINSGDEAVNLLDATRATAVMPGRGLIGNPWLVNGIRSSLNGTKSPSPDLDEKKEVVMRHLSYLYDFYGERTGVILMR